VEAEQVRLVTHQPKRQERLEPQTQVVVLAVVVRLHLVELQEPLVVRVS
jgi:hypothetical protein